MNVRRFFPVAPLLLIVLGACNPAGEGDRAQGETAGTGAADTAEPAVTPPPARPAPGAPPEPGAPSGDEALALLVAVNQHEIAAAEQARDKQVGGKVMEFADMMLAEHSSNLEATRQLANEAAGAAESPRVVSLRASGEADLNRLSELEGQEYEQAYVEAMVEDHRKALDMLDNQLIPAARDDAVREHLSMTRERVAAHLEQARALQSE